MRRSWDNTEEWCGYECHGLVERWVFTLDMNRDGLTTISDLTGCWGYLFYAPGDALIYFLIINAGGFARFMELSTASYGGFGSGILSFLAWWAVYGVFVYADKVDKNTAK